MLQGCSTGYLSVACKLSLLFFFVPLVLLSPRGIAGGFCEFFHNATLSSLLMLLPLPLQHVASLSSFYASRFPSVCECVCVPASQYTRLSLCVCACFLSICATISLMPLAFCVLPVYFCQLLFVIIFRSFAAF